MAVTLAVSPRYVEQAKRVAVALYVWGALRRIEARIGELLGPGKPPPGPGRGKPSVMTDGLDRDSRSDCRQLADLVHRGVLRYGARQTAL